MSNTEPDFNSIWDDFKNSIKERISSPVFFLFTLSILAYFKKSIFIIINGSYTDGLAEIDKITILDHNSLYILCVFLIFLAIYYILNALKVIFKNLLIAGYRFCDRFFDKFIYCTLEEKAHLKSSIETLADKNRLLNETIKQNELNKFDIIKAIINRTSGIETDNYVYEIKKNTSDHNRPIILNIADELKEDQSLKNIQPKEKLLIPILQFNDGHFLYQNLNAAFFITAKSFSTRNLAKIYKVSDGNIRVVFDGSKNIYYDEKLNPTFNKPKFAPYLCLSASESGVSVTLFSDSNNLPLNNL